MSRRVTVDADLLRRALEDAIDWCETLYDAQYGVDSNAPATAKRLAGYKAQIARLNETVGRPAQPLNDALANAKPVTLSDLVKSGRVEELGVEEL